MKLNIKEITNEITKEVIKSVVPHIKSIIAKERKRNEIRSRELIKDALIEILMKNGNNSGILPSVAVTQKKNKSGSLKEHFGISDDMVEEEPNNEVMNQKIANSRNAAKNIVSNMNLFGKEMGSEFVSLIANAEIPNEATMIEGVDATFRPAAQVVDAAQVDIREVDPANMNFDSFL